MLRGLQSWRSLRVLVVCGVTAATVAAYYVYLVFFWHPDVQPSLDLLKGKLAGLEGQLDAMRKADLFVTIHADSTIVVSGNAVGGALQEVSSWEELEAIAGTKTTSIAAGFVLFRGEEPEMRKACKVQARLQDMFSRYRFDSIGVIIGRQVQSKASGSWDFLLSGIQCDKAMSEATNASDRQGKLLANLSLQPNH